MLIQKLNRAKEMQSSSHTDLDYYATLGVDANASLADIKTAFKNLALKYHPDKTLDDPIATEKMKEINVAYLALTNKAKNQIDIEKCIEYYLTFDDIPMDILVYCILPYFNSHRDFLNFRQLGSKYKKAVFHFFNDVSKHASYKTDIEFLSTALKSHLASSPMGFIQLLDEVHPKAIMGLIDQYMKKVCTVQIEQGLQENAPHVLYLLDLLRLNYMTTKTYYSHMKFEALKAHFPILSKEFLHDIEIMNLCSELDLCTGSYLVGDVFNRVIAFRNVANAKYLNFQGVKLHGCGVEYLKGHCLRYTNFTNSSLREFDCTKTDFHACRFDETVLRLLTCRETNFSYASFYSSKWYAVRMSHCDFSYADLSLVAMGKHSDVEWHTCNLKGTAFLRHCNFKDSADLSAQLNKIQTSFNVYDLNAQDKNALEIAIANDIIRALKTLDLSTDHKIATLAAVFDDSQLDLFKTSNQLSCTEKCIEYFFDCRINNEPTGLDLLKSYFVQLEEERESIKLFRNLF